MSFIAVALMLENTCAVSQLCTLEMAGLSCMTGST